MSARFHYRGTILSGSTPLTRVAPPGLVEENVSMLAKGASSLSCVVHWAINYKLALRGPRFPGIVRLSQGTMTERGDITPYITSH